ncbi:diguanylate cyclase [Shewanella yunxiaonensis]|uniref:diguanylate cyclase n=1 Tax=Shewanella yunxiaonensis TaxID=2829809 RepID=A0ABX7YX15_9GAMM|nr:diguanylate cyclase [Shewanella yunxiaonensis]QUN07242.1 diguanylate cyclase [Shewanella yunxiaonensis]
MTYWTRLLVFVALILISEIFTSSVEAADVGNIAPLNRYFKETWTTRQGLPHNTINSIDQTPEGYLWLSSWEGVARFNGKDFKMFGRDSITGLPDVGTRASFLDNSGRLIIGGARGGLTSVKDGKWTPFAPVGVLINVLWVDDKNNIWIGTEGGGLFRQDPQGVRQQWTTVQGLPSNTIYSFANAADGGLWIGTAAGMVLWQHGQLSPVAALHKVPVFDLLKTHDGLIIASENGVSRLVGDKVIPLHPDLTNVAVSQLMLDHQGSLWMGTVQQGIFRLSKAYGLEHLDASHGMPSNRVLDLFEDKEQSIWIGTNGGLFRLRDAPFSTITTEQGLAGNYVRALLSEPNGDIWIGSSRGLSRYSRAKGFVTEIVLPGESILSLAQMADGRLLIGTYTAGVFIYDNGQTKLLVDRDSGLISNEVRALLQDPDGSIWIGTAQGLAHWHDGSVDNLTTQDGLPGNFIVELLRCDNKMWIGTGTGIAIYQNGKFSVMPIHQFDVAEYAFGMFPQEKKRLLWVATDRGLLRHNLDTDETVLIGRRNGLPFDKFFQLVIDDYGNVWLTSNRGILRFSEADANAVADGRMSTLSTVLYGESDGMLSAQANGGSNPTMVKTPEGTVWIATAMGATSVRPQRLQQFAEHTPQVVVERISMDGQEQSLTNNLTLPAAAQRVEINYAGLSFIMPTRLRYRTKLDGFDQDWRDKTGLNQVEYTNLAPGTYQLDIQSANPGGRWSPSAQLTIIKLPFWWQTLLAKYIALAATVLVIVGFTYWRTASLRRSEQYLLQQVARKTAELQQQTHNLETANQEKSVLLDKLQQQALALEIQAKQDSLTGLANRRAFDEHLAQEYARAKRLQQPLTLAFIDIDHFKWINDKFSHSVGDKALVKLAAQLKLHCRAIDIAARWGGEEFSLLLPTTTSQQAIQVCERLRMAVESMDCSSIAEGLKLTVSIGLACSDDVEESWQLLNAADDALYRAKNNGRNRVESFI